MECSRFLNFDPTDIPEWRKKAEKFQHLPNIKQMLNDILSYKNIWEKAEIDIDSELKKKVERKIFLEFLYRVQEEEDIGIMERKSFEDICETFTYKTLEKEIQKQDAAGSLKIDENSTSEQIKLLETVRLLWGYKCVQNDLNEIPQIERKSCLGMIGTPCSIKQYHQELMKGLIDPQFTRPGKFSTNPRDTDYKGKTYLYPSYETEEIASNAIQTLLDKYHKMLDEIKVDDVKGEQLNKSFKCASVLLFTFLTLHPFSDGNGRLARLLCDRCLNIFCPFPSPIYNVFSPSSRDDYIKALIEGRKHLKLSEDKLQFKEDALRETCHIMEQKPSDLCSLIIESNWFMWRKFLCDIGLGKDIKLFEFEHLTKEVTTS